MWPPVGVVDAVFGVVNLLYGSSAALFVACRELQILI